jgi:preprotein translocase subunit SecY
MDQQPEEKKSRLYVLEPLVDKLPEVEVPKRHVAFRERFIWTGFALAIFLVMTQISLYGLHNQPVASLFGYYRFVFASHAGSLMELGIGPIVTAGIIIQLLVGSKIIGLDLAKPEDRALFTGVQKFLAILVGIFMAAMYAFGMYPSQFGISLTTGESLFIVLELSIGVVAVIYLDELVSKYGFGSGISLFIAAGVSAEIFIAAFNPLSSYQGSVVISGQLFGAIPNMIKALVTGVPGVGEAFFRSGTNAPSMWGVIATVIIFLIAVYAESMRVEIPLAYGRFGGTRGRYPIKFLYASVIPVILAGVLFMNVRLFAGILSSRGYPILGTFDNRGNPTGGLVFYTSAPNNLFQGNPTNPDVIQNPLRAVTYLVILVVLCMAFAWLWINMTGMGPRDIAEQLDSSGMLIPGFRRDIRVMEQVLSRYITVVTILGGATIGALAATADFLGAVGSGTGILLTVGIIYGLYEEIAREQVVEMFPAIRRFFGG